jgi:cell wall-associated NlpC family hydrolase
LDKVKYFWGGKSLVLGWDSRWGTPMRVTADDSPTTGSLRPFGLDCSGFVDWVFYNAYGGEYIIGHGGGAADQYSYCDAIAWNSAQPGDLVFYPDSEHVGIVVKNDAGTLTIIHCASGYNNVVITQHTQGNGFAFIGRPQIYGE